MNIPKKVSDNQQPPFWYLWHNQVTVVCPYGHVATLDHTIDASGKVDPSLLCPKEGCTFHEHAVLENWTPL